MRNIQKLKERTSGFTIIEVMIVLAIAGLILLIVFLAVPALQRNAHNTSIKNDVSSLLGGMNEYENNNNGGVPTAISASTTTSVTIGAAGTNTVVSKVGYVDGTTVTLSALSGAGTATASATPGVVNLYTHAICSATVGQATAVGATSRNVVALYSLEGGAVQCQAS